MHCDYNYLDGCLINIYYTYIADTFTEIRIFEIESLTIAELKSFNNLVEVINSYVVLFEIQTLKPEKKLIMRQRCSELVLYPVVHADPLPPYSLHPSEGV